MPRRASAAVMRNRNGQVARKRQADEEDASGRGNETDDSGDGTQSSQEINNDDDDDNDDNSEEMDQVSLEGMVPKHLETLQSDWDNFANLSTTAAQRQVALFHGFSSTKSFREYMRQQEIISQPHGCPNINEELRFTWQTWDLQTAQHRKELASKNGFSSVAALEEYLSVQVCQAETAASSDTNRNDDEEGGTSKDNDNVRVFGKARDDSPTGKRNIATKKKTRKRRRSTIIPRELAYKRTVAANFRESTANNITQDASATRHQHGHGNIVEQTDEMEPRKQTTSKRKRGKRIQTVVPHKKGKGDDETRPNNGNGRAEHQAASQQLDNLISAASSTTKPKKRKRRKRIIPRELVYKRHKR